MRLLERDPTGEFRLTKHLPNDKIPPYAILSHTWGDEEVVFRDLAGGTAKNKNNAGYSKIQFCGEQAERDGLRYFWVDTCCIDKSDAGELQHALNSMFQWYRNAAKCYVYLPEVSTRKRDADGSSKCYLNLRDCRWFTRGWTLQELIAPAIVEFFSKDGERLGDKKSLEKEIHNITGIPQRALQGSPLSDFSVAEWMKWIEKRNTKYEEDKTYSPFGIFDVHIPVLYGEGGQKALKRLRDKIHEDYLCLAKLWSADPRDPRHEKERIELAKGGLLADAYRWVFDNPDFKRWRQLSESRLLWIKGDPGKGKTMLLCGIINELERPITVNGGNLAYFFCQAADSRINNATSVLRGLIYLLVQRQPRLLSHLPENTYPSDDAMAWIVLSKTLIEMLEDPNLKVTYLVIDALDECIIDQQQLLSLIVQISSVSAHVKLVVSSRNLVQIEEQLASVAQQARISLELNAESVTAAVEAFIRHKVLCLSQLKQYDSTMENFIRDYLSSDANGTFLWVALVCQALADPDVQEWHTREVLHTFPPGLDDLYLRMVRYIKKSKDRLHCKRILATVSVVQRPINLRELATLVELTDSITSYRERLEKLIAICGSFLALREQSIYFVHQSAKDFLLGKADLETSREACQEAFSWVFPQGTEDIHHIIFSRSLNAMSLVLRRDMYNLKAPGFPIDKVQPLPSDPLATVRYSCVFWVDHLCNSTPNKDTPQRNTLDSVQTFVEQKYLYWLEALSLLRAMPDGVIAITQLNGLLPADKTCF
ncbi:NACHT domain containing protein [Rhypophila decipiens]